MKQSLFSRLDEAALAVRNAQAGVVAVCSNQASYNYQVAVTTTKKHRVVKKWKWTKNKTTYHTHYETRFDQARYNKDLASAKAKLQAAVQVQLQIQQSITSQIDGMKSQASYVNKLQSDVNGLKNTSQYLKSKVPFVSTSYNLSSKVTSYQTRLSSIQHSKTQTQRELSELPSKIKQERTKSVVVKNKGEQSLEAVKKVNNERSDSYIALQQKISSLSELEKATLVYGAFVSGNQLMLTTLKSCGYWKEFAAYIAVCKNNDAVFAELLKEGLELDQTLAIEGTGNITLALAILKSANAVMWAEMFKHSTELAQTAYLAAINGEYEVLKELLAHDSEIFNKIEDLPGCGLSLLKLAVLDNNSELIEFIANSQVSMFDAEENLFGMALRMQDITSDTIRIIAKYVDVMKRIEEYIKTNQVTMVDLVFNKVDLTVEEYRKIFKLCANSELEDKCGGLTEKIGDVRQFFLKTLQDGDQETVMQLMYFAEEDITEEYLKSLIANSDADDSSIQVLKELLQDDEVTQDNTTTINVGGDYDLQIDN